MTSEQLTLEERFVSAIAGFAKRNNLRHRTYSHQFNKKCPKMLVGEIWEYGGPYIPAALEKGANKVIVGYWDNRHSDWFGDFRAYLKEEYNIDSIDGEGKTDVQLFGLTSASAGPVSDFVLKTNSA